MSEQETSNKTSDEDDDLSFALNIILQFVLFLFVAMMTASVDKKTLLSRFSFKDKAVVIGLFIKFFLSPIIGLITINIPFFSDSLSVPDKVVLLAIMSSPGGTFSNLLCSLFNADLAASVSMSAISTLTSIFFLPFNLFVYVTKGLSQDEVKIDFLQLCYTIIAVEAGVAFGIYLNYKFPNPNLQHRFNFFGGLLGGVILIISVSLSQSEEGLFASGLGFVLACGFSVALCGIIGLVLTTLGNVSKPERLAVAIESNYQNTAIATGIAFATFSLEDARKAINVTVVHGLWQFVVSLIILFIGWKAGWTYAPDDTPACNFFLGNFQPGVGSAKVILEDVDEIASKVELSATATKVEDIAIETDTIDETEKPSVETL